MSLARVWNRLSILMAEIEALRRGLSPLAPPCGPEPSGGGPFGAPQNSIERVAERLVLIKNGEEIENADPN